MKTIAYVADAAEVPEVARAAQLAADAIDRVLVDAGDDTFDELQDAVYGGGVGRVLLPSLSILGQALGHNFGAENVRGVTAQFRAPVLPGDRLRVEGSVSEIVDVGDGRRAVCDLRVVRAGEAPGPDCEVVVVVGTGQVDIG